jgi:hypothetical protein
MRTLLPLLLTVFMFTSLAVAQDKEKVEIGVQSTSLTIFQPDFSFSDTQAGVGGRVTYNFNRFIAAEAEINFLTQKQFILTAEGRAIQAQFGVKLGKRFEKFGVFGKLRPGFLSVNRVGSYIPGPAGPHNELDFTIERKEFLSIDAGGVLELYPSKRTVLRFDVGDTIIRHPALYQQVFILGPVELIRPAKFKHNFQFTAGVAFRLGDFPADESHIQTSSSSNTRTMRFEVGAQFTSLFVAPGKPPGLASLPGLHAEPGVGGRFTFNLTDNVAFEAEGNYYTRNQLFSTSGGHMFQGQFGVKAGKRFEKWGLFAKARPGFIGFTRVFEFGGAQVRPADFFVTKHYPSLDVGGVVEIYVSRRVMARFDAGNTIIRYGEVRIPGVAQPFVIQARETRHNFQLSSGVGFRF